MSTYLWALMRILGIFYIKAVNLGTAVRNTTYSNECKHTIINIWNYYLAGTTNQEVEKAAWGMAYGVAAVEICAVMGTAVAPLRHPGRDLSPLPNFLVPGYEFINNIGCCWSDFKLYRLHCANNLQLNLWAQCLDRATRESIWRYLQEHCG